VQAYRFFYPTVSIMATWKAAWSPTRPSRCWRAQVPAVRWEYFIAHERATFPSGVRDGEFDQADQRF
jgi:hypothetical protein